MQLIKSNHGKIKARAALKTADESVKDFIHVILTRFPEYHGAAPISEVCEALGVSERPVREMVSDLERYRLGYRSAMDWVVINWGVAEALQEEGYAL